MANFLAALIGHVKGGLSYVLLGAMYLVSGISGSKAADIAAVAPILFQEMRRRGAHPGELASLLATSSAMSETIPPSLVLITIGSVTNISIVALFTGGLLPAFVAALGLVVVAWFLARSDDTGAGTRAPVMLMARTFVIAVLGLNLPFVIRAAVIGGSPPRPRSRPSASSIRLCLGYWSTASSTGVVSIRSSSTRSR